MHLALTRFGANEPNAVNCTSKKLLAKVRIQMSDKVQTTTIGFRLDASQIELLRGHQLPNERSLHEVARRLLLDRLTMLSLDSVLFEIEASRQEVRSFRSDFSKVAKHLMLMTDKVEEEEIQAWFQRNIGGD